MKPGTRVAMVGITGGAALLTALTDTSTAATAAQAGSGSTGAARVATTEVKHSTTLHVNGKSAHVWKSWSHYKGGGYQGHFGTYSVASGIHVLAYIRWNSGKIQYVTVAAHSKHVYYGAKIVYLAACTPRNIKCSKYW